jgi:hypothetical protein
MSEGETTNLKQFLETLGHLEEPMGMFYTDRRPTEGFSPRQSRLPTVEQEARNG